MTSVAAWTHIPGAAGYSVARWAVRDRAAEGRDHREADAEARARSAGAPDGLAPSPLARPRRLQFASVGAARPCGGHPSGKAGQHRGRLPAAATQDPGDVRLQV